MKMYNDAAGQGGEIAAGPAKNLVFVDVYQRGEAINLYLTVEDARALGADLFAGAARAEAQR